MKPADDLQLRMVPPSYLCPFLDFAEQGPQRSPIFVFFLHFFLFCLVSKSRPSCLFRLGSRGAPGVLQVQQLPYGHQSAVHCVSATVIGARGVFPGTRLLPTRPFPGGHHRGAGARVFAGPVPYPGVPGRASGASRLRFPGCIDRNLHGWSEPGTPSTLAGDSHTQLHAQ